MDWSLLHSRVVGKEQVECFTKFDKGRTPNLALPTCYYSYSILQRLDTNSPSIFTQHDTNSTYSQRIYAVSQTFPLKKPQKVRDTNLTYPGYGRLNLRRVFDVLAGVTGG